MLGYFELGLIAHYLSWALRSYDDDLNPEAIAQYRLR
jgi:hypothetical protein